MLPTNLLNKIIHVVNTISNTNQIRYTLYIGNYIPTLRRNDLNWWFCTYTQYTRTPNKVYVMHHVFKKYHDISFLKYKFSLKYGDLYLSNKTI